MIGKIEQSTLDALAAIGKDADYNKKMWERYITSERDRAMAAACKDVEAKTGVKSSENEGNR